MNIVASCYGVFGELNYKCFRVNRIFYAIINLNSISNPACIIESFLRLIEKADYLFICFALQAIMMSEIINHVFADKESHQIPRLIPLFFAKPLLNLT